MLGKKSSATFALLGLVLNTTVVNAHTSVNAHKPIYKDNQDFAVVNPQPRFEFSIAAIALRPGASNLNYVIYNKALPTQSPSWTEEELRPTNKGAFELEGRYIFPEGQYVGLDWTHLSSNTSSTTNAPNSLYFLGPDYEIGPDAIPTRNSTGNVKFRYDVVNLDVGQAINFGRHVEVHIFGGISDGMLREQVTSSYSGPMVSTVFPGPFNMEQIVTADFMGIGPRFGFDASYNCDSGFGLIGQAAVSTLIGSTRAKTIFIGTSEELTAVFGQAVNNQFIRDKDVSQVVPGLETKLGVSYKHGFARGSQLTIEAGYQAAVYINAINQYLPGSLVGGAESLNTGGIFVATMSHTQSNYSVQGPFLKGSLTF